MTRLDLLRVLADRLEAKLADDSVSAHAYAPLAGQYRDTLEQIAALEAAEDQEADELDELRARRDAKRDAG